METVITLHLEKSGQRKDQCVIGSDAAFPTIPTVCCLCVAPANAQLNLATWWLSSRLGHPVGTWETLPLDFESWHCTPSLLSRVRWTCNLNFIFPKSLACQSRERVRSRAQLEKNHPVRECHGTYGATVSATLGNLSCLLGRNGRSVQELSLLASQGWGHWDSVLTSPWPSVYNTNLWGEWPGLHKFFKQLQCSRGCIQAPWAGSRWSHRLWDSCIDFERLHEVPGASCNISIRVAPEECRLVAWLAPHEL